MPKVSSLKTKAEYRGPSSKGKFSDTDVQIDWEGPVLHYKSGIFWKKLAFKDVVNWQVAAEPGSKLDKNRMFMILHIIKLSTAKEMREFALPPQEFEKWLYWIIRSLIKHSEAPMPDDRVSQSPMLEKHKLKTVTSRDINVFDRAHQVFINTLDVLDGVKEVKDVKGKKVLIDVKGMKGNKQLGVTFSGEIKGEGKTEINFTVKRSLGHGGSGTNIYEINGLLKEIKKDGTRTEEPVAVKTSGTSSVVLFDDTQRTAITDMIKEARVLAALGKHPNIVGLVDTAVSENRFCLFLEMGSCDLKHLKEKYPALTEHDILGYAMDILAGMTHMHKCRVFHLDMKPENVIICQMKGKVAKIIDFGLARSATLHNKKERLSAPGSWASMGTDCYICPEAWELGGDDLPDDEFLAKRDSFAVGLTLINGLLVPFLNLEKKAELVAMKVARSGLGEEKETVVDRIKYWKQNLRQETAKQGKKMLLDLAEAACGLIDEYYRTRLTVEDALRLVKKNAEFVKTKKGMFEITKI